MSRVTPLQSWENFRKRIAELGGTVLEPEYLGSGRGHRCRCAQGHECRPHPSHVQQGKGICPVCAGNDTATARDAFYKRIAELGGTVLEPQWRGNSRSYLCLCPNGHECRPWPSHVKEGIGMCRTCAGQDSAIAEENFRRRVAELGGVVLEPKWLGNGKPHRCRCIQGHKCRPRPGHVQQGRGICLTCAGKDPVTAEENFHRRVTELGGIVLEPTWLGNGTPHLVRCSNNHERRIVPSNIQQGRGICQNCGGKNNPLNVQKTTAARDAFYKRVAELGGIVLEPTWLGNPRPHRCRCVRGHECRPQPSHVRKGQGICRTCAWWDQDVLYVTRNPATGCVKFGITGGDGRDRLGVHRTAGYTEILRLETGLPEGVAVLAEQKIKTALEMAGAVPVRGVEYFSGEHLALIDNEIDNWVPARQLSS